MQAETALSLCHVFWSWRQVTVDELWLFILGFHLGMVILIPMFLAWRFLVPRFSEHFRWWLHVDCIWLKLLCGVPVHTASRQSQSIFKLGMMSRWITVSGLLIVTKFLKVILVTRFFNFGFPSFVGSSPSSKWSLKVSRCNARWRPFPMQPCACKESRHLCVSSRITSVSNKLLSSSGWRDHRGFASTIWTLWKGWASESKTRLPRFASVDYQKT